MSLGAAVFKSGKDVIKKYFDTSIENYDEIDNKTRVLFNDKKCSFGNKLELCTFHSCFSPDTVKNRRRKDYDYYLMGIDDYAFCTTDLKVYDLCHMKEEKSKRDKDLFIKIINEKVNKYDHNMEITYRIHEDFMINIEKRKQLIQKKTEFEKVNGSTTSDIQQNPQYILLLQLLQREEETLENKRKHIEKIYNLKAQEISKDDFIASYTKDEVEKRDKAKSNLDHWCNKNQKISLTKEQEFLVRIDTAIHSITENLNICYETPCVYIYKAIKALDEITAYYKKDFRQKDLVEKASIDLNKCKKNFEIYKEFIGDKDINSIIKKIEHEQAQAASDERKNKNNLTSTQKVKSSNTSFVVKLDGTVAKDTNKEPKLIIGGTVSTIVNDSNEDRWKDLRK
jgi:hypothetical protein